MFAPHGLCLQWDPELLVVHILSDAVIALSYFSIPFALAYFVSKRKDVEFGWVFWAFAIFIMACGISHVMSIYTLWVPAYGLEGVVKFMTAIASIATAILLWPLVPKLLALPSPAQLRLAHAMLDAEAQQRREAEARLLQSQKMEAVGQLTGGIAHDFNNLLMVISGNLEIARRALGQHGQTGLKRATRAVESASDGAQRAATLTSRLLAFARKQPLDAKVVDLNSIITGMAEFFQRTLGETIKLNTISSAGLWRVETDPNLLEAALLNIVVNARDAMPDGGTLTIETGNACVDEDTARSIDDLQAGHYVVISVTDDGVGMDAETIERAFEPFFSTKQTGHGTGLGLSQVYGFCKQSGGIAKIYSKRGAGTTVKLYLPRSLHEREEEASLTNPLHPQIRGMGETIMVVEDDEGVRRYVVETLTDLNYRIIEAKSAEEAVLVFGQNSREIALLLTDIVMPGRNGRHLSDVLCKQKPGLKVIFMTGYSRDAIVHNGRLDPGVELLQKPFTQAALAQKLRQLLGFYG